MDILVRKQNSPPSLPKRAANLQRIPWLHQRGFTPGIRTWTVGLREADSFGRHELTFRASTAGYALIPIRARKVVLNVRTVGVTVFVTLEVNGVYAVEDRY
jgi:hypothetical protein